MPFLIDQLLRSALGNSGNAKCAESFAMENLLIDGSDEA